MFGRGTFKQFTGEWDPDKNVFTNILNSYFATIKNTLVKKDYLFVGREFEKFYADKGEIDYEISSGKKIYKVVGDKTLAKDVSVSMKRSRLYNQVSDYMTSIRKIDSAKIDVPREYVNNIYNIIDNLNRNEDKKALKSLLDLSASYDFNNFINNAKRKIEEERRKKVKEDYENKSTD